MWYSVVSTYMYYIHITTNDEQKQNKTITVLVLAFFFHTIIGIALGFTARFLQSCFLLLRASTTIIISIVIITTLLWTKYKIPHFLLDLACWTQNCNRAAKYPCCIFVILNLHYFYYVISHILYVSLWSKLLYQNRV